MPNLLRWAILAVWVGLALVVLAAIVTTIVGATLHTVLDRRGVRGTIWCPDAMRTYRVLGIPSSFPCRPFDDLKRCERFGTGPLTCGKPCLRLPQAAALGA